jgi:hypothetical protein
MEGKKRKRKKRDQIIPVSVKKQYSHMYIKITNTVHFTCCTCQVQFFLWKMALLLTVWQRPKSQQMVVRHLPMLRMCVCEPLVKKICDDSEKTMRWNLGPVKPFQVFVFCPHGFKGDECYYAQMHFHLRRSEDDAEKKG